MQYRLREQSATAGADFVDTSGELQWTDGDSDVKAFTINISTDVEVEGSERFVVELFDAEPAGSDRLGASELNVTITDSTVAEPVSLAVVGDRAVRVREADGAIVRIAVSRSGESQSRVVLPFILGSDDDTAEQAGYIAQNGQLIWSPGEMEDKFIAVGIVNDQIQEIEESVSITFGDPVSTWPDSLIDPPVVPVVSGPGQPVSVVIVDDDLEPPQADANDPVYVLDVAAGDEQRATPGEPLSLPLQVMVRSPSGTQGIEGLGITWVVLPDPMAANPEVAVLVSATGQVLGNTVETISDENGMAQVFVNVLRSGFIGIRATPTANLVSRQSAASNDGYLAARMRADRNRSL